MFWIIVNYSMVAVNLFCLFFYAIPRTIRLRGRGYLYVGFCTGMALIMTMLGTIELIDYLARH
jgi:hypothetical protein